LTPSRYAEKHFEAIVDYSDKDYSIIFGQKVLREFLKIHPLTHTMHRRLANVRPDRLD
jgi:hypothetical protein